MLGHALPHLRQLSAPECNDSSPNSLPSLSTRNSHPWSFCRSEEILSEDIRGLKSQPRDIAKFVELGQCYFVLRVTKTVLGFSDSLGLTGLGKAVTLEV